MKATLTELEILGRLSACRYLPGTFDKKFPRQIDTENISPLQKWWIYKLGYKYRRQIGNDAIESVCKKYLEANTMPAKRKESARLLKNISKSGILFD